MKRLIKRRSGDQSVMTAMKFYPESVMGEEVSFQLEVRQAKAWSKKERL